MTRRLTRVRGWQKMKSCCRRKSSTSSTRTANHVNLIVIDKQPQLQWLDIDQAIAHCARRASVWPWASTDHGGEPNVVLAAAGDIPTLEVVAAAWWLRQHAPELRVRVVNVVDLTTLFPPEVHPHGMDEAAFVDMFTRSVDVVFAFHGYFDSRPRQREAF